MSWCSGGHGLLSCLGDRADYTEGTMRAAVKASREEERISLTRQAPVAKCQAAQTIDGDRITFEIHKLAEESARVRIEGVDVAIAEVADEDGLAERPKVCWS